MKDLTMESTLFGKEPEFNVVQKTFLSSKLLRVKWKPDGNYLVTGSYSDPRNQVELWHFPKDQDCSSGYPKRKCTLETKGDVSELKFVDNERFVFSTKRGELSMMRIGEEKLDLVSNWGQNEFVGNSIDGFDVSDEKIIAVVTGEGMVACFSLVNQSLPSTTIGSCRDKVESISFMNSHTLAMGNLRGQVSITDLREDEKKPAMRFPYNRDVSVGVTAIKAFPVRKHMLVASGMDGSVTTWDLRKPLVSQTIYPAHGKPISSLVFHPTRPSNLFTTSFSGEVFHWRNFSDLLGGAEPTGNLFNQPVGGPQGDKTPDVTCLMGETKFATNHCDVLEDRLVFCTDNDALVFVNNLQLK